MKSMMSRILRTGWMVAWSLLFAFTVACTTSFPRDMLPHDGGGDPDTGPTNCGNSTVDPGEDCDGAELGGQTCAGLGYDSGELACTGACGFDTSSCEGAAICADGRCETARGESALSCPEDCAFIAVQGGERHSCGVRADRSAWCWGDNASGQLGTGDLASSLVPVQVAGVAELSSVAPGWGQFSCALSSGGAVWCWGENGDGQLGTGDNTSSSDPILVDNLSGVDALSVGNAHVCVLTADGMILCWGKNDRGQLGIDSVEPASTVPVQVTGLANATQVSAGKEHTCALDPNQDAWCWGHNDKYQLGTGDNVDTTVPVAVTGLSTVIQISAGGNDTCAVLDDRTVWCWGDNARGQLGTGELTESLVPVQVLNLQEVDAVWAGEHFACALKVDGTVWCWGENGDGQLGDDTSADSSVPVQVSGLTNAQTLGQGKKHTFALTTEQRVWGWGRNDRGQLGDNSTTSRLVPVPIGED